MRRVLVPAVGLWVMLALVGTAAPEDDADKTKQALQAFNEYIGSWKINGEPGRKSDDASLYWNEDQNWGWKFKGNDVWIAFESKNGKYHKAGELRYDLGKKRYELTLTAADGTKQVFEGEKKKKGFEFTRTDPATKKVQVLEMNTTNEGARMNVTFTEKKTKTATIGTKLFVAAGAKEGEAIAGGKKGPECVVTGGLGTTAVSFGGKTYYVCCSGCRDAFAENPAKYVKAFEEAKKK